MKEFKTMRTKEEVQERLDYLEKEANACKENMQNALNEKDYNTHDVLCHHWQHLLTKMAALYWVLNSENDTGVSNA